jgi:hypothetical protein
MQTFQNKIPHKPYIFFIFSTLLLLFFVSGCMLPAPQYGSQDSGSAKTIKHINSNTKLRSAGEFTQLAQSLQTRLKTLADDNYAAPRLSNELAELYSYQLLDIEKAIYYDELLLRQNIADKDVSGNTLPLHSVAQGEIISDNDYVEKYLAINKSTLVETAEKRLKKNQSLVSGKKPQEKRYAIKRLSQHIQSVKRDLSHKNISKSKRRQLISRLIKAEYELRKQSSSYVFQAHTYFLQNDISVATIDLLEIDFLRLADYCTQVYQQTNNVLFAEYALETIYLPYLNLQNTKHRWQFNRLVNQYISTLIEAHYKKSNYEEMLYYTSLNKSRMLLEERILLTKKNTGSDNNTSFDSANHNNLPPTASGLPDKATFKNRLAKVDSFVDFYIDGKYYDQSNTQINLAQQSSMPMVTRYLGSNPTDNKIEVFKDTAIYIAYIQGGKVKYSKKITGKKLSALKQELDTSLNDIVNNGQHNKRSATLKWLGKEMELPPQVTISPDKWIARHPLNFHLDRKTVRAVNLFTSGSQSPLKKLNLVGFFNPTLDLEGAEAEASAIRSVLPEATIFTREKAEVSYLKNTQGGNLVHLSMHGSFDAQKPQYSKLYFAGATLQIDNYDDPKALYAKDIVNYPLLRNRQLIFAAACETGKIAPAQINETELMGILRPLTVNGNKNIILSLWQVDDLATRDFVDWFYQKLAKTHKVAESFLYAQDQTRKKYISPYYWAPFYLSQSN